MYGTVARYRIKPGREADVLALSRELAGDPPDAFVGAIVFRLDSGGDEYITAAVYRDREGYRRNSEDPRQQRWAERVGALLEGHPSGTTARSSTPSTSGAHPSDRFFAPVRPR